MKKRLKYGTLLLLILFINTIGFSGYAQASAVKCPTDYAISQRVNNRESSQILYNLCAETPKVMSIDNCSIDQDVKWCVKFLTAFCDKIISEKYAIVINIKQLPLMTIKSNDYYIFALRKISI